MIRLVVLIVCTMALLVSVATAQQPTLKGSPGATEVVAAGEPALAASAAARLEKLALERQAISLQLQILERDYSIKQRDLQDKTRDLEAAIVDEAGKAKLDAKQYRPDLGTKTWKKTAQ